MKLDDIFCQKQGFGINTESLASISTASIGNVVEKKEVQATRLFNQNIATSEPYVISYLRYQV